MSDDEELPANASVFTTWVIYERPIDYPKHYVLRAHHLLPSGEMVPDRSALVAPNIEMLRAEMRRRGLVCLTRNEEDDPCIVETWL